MHYHVTRNGQTYGPYTLEDLQRYLASGNVLPTDLAKTDEMTEWLPVSQILRPPVSQPTGGQTAAPVSAFSTPGYANPTVDPVCNPAAALAASPYPDAPNLHWGLVLLFSFLTCFFFVPIWQLVIAVWLKKVQPNATALFWYIGFVVLVLVRWIVSVALIGSIFRHGMVTPDNVSIGAGSVGLAMLNHVLGLAALVIVIVANFMTKSSLEEHFNTVEPVGLQLSGVMTFFFAPWYFQYHLNKISAMKQAARFGAPRPY